MLCVKRLKNNHDSSLEYSVYIDDVCEGYVDDGKYLKIKVNEGIHRVKVLYDYGHSDEMSIDFHQDEDVNLICGLDAGVYKETFKLFNNTIKSRKSMLFLEYETNESVKARKRMEKSRRKIQVFFNVLFFISGIAFWEMILGDGIGRYIGAVIFVGIFIGRLVYRWVSE